MMKQVVTAMSAALVLVFAAVALTNAAEESGPGKMSPMPQEVAASAEHKHSPEAFIKKLGITDEQKKQIRGLYVAFKDRTRKTRTDLMALKDEKKTMLMSGKIDQQRLAQIDDQIVKLKTDLLKERLKLKRDRLALLTPEQIDKLADVMAHRAFHSKMKKMHGHHGRGGMHG
jgi:Spy/CpxP family protein refolding chaperone